MIRRRRPVTSAFATLLFAGAMIVVPGVDANPSLAAARASCHGTQLRPKVHAEVSRRQTTLEALVTELQARRDPFNMNARQTSALKAADSGLRPLDVWLQTTCYATLAAFRADATKVFVDYRVYWLRQPQTHVIAAADQLSEIHDQLAQIAARLATLVGTNVAAQHDLATMNAALNAAQAKLGTPPNVAPSIAAVARLRPAADMSSNERALRAAHADLSAARDDLTQARDAARNVLADFKTPRA